MANTGGQNNLRQLVAELQKVHTSGDYDRAVKTAAKSKYCILFIYHLDSFQLSVVSQRKLMLTNVS